MAENKYIYQKINLLTEKISRYFLSIEWPHLSYIDPLFFIDNYFKNNKHFNLSQPELKKYCFDNLQVIFHKILKRFLQGPIDKYYLDFIKNQLDRYLIFRNVFLNNQYSVEPKPIFNLTSQSQLIISLFNDLNDLKKQIPLPLISETVVIPNKFNFQDFRKLGWQYRVIDFLQKTSQKKLSFLIDCFLVHGSFATKDFLDKWSDLDALIILNNRVFQDVKTLNYFKKNIRRLSLTCYKIDPLNHHLFFFLTNFDLNYYPACFFPPVLFNYSVLLLGRANLEIKLRPDNYQKIQAISDFTERFRNKFLKAEYSRNLARWKEDLAQVMLLPSLLLQAKGIYLYKKDSFGKAKRVFPELDFSVVEQATNLMKNWSRPNLLKYYPNLFFDILPQRLNQAIINRYRKSLMELPIRQSREQIKKITQEALNLMEQAISLILRDLS